MDIVNEGAWDDAYTEGNARQYRWLVPHDPEGLVQAMDPHHVAMDAIRDTGMIGARQYGPGQWLIVCVDGKWREAVVAEAVVMGVRRGQ